MRKSYDLPIRSTNPDPKESSLAEPLVIETSIVAPASPPSPMVMEKSDAKSRKPLKKPPLKSATAPKRPGHPPKNSKEPELPLSTTPKLDSEE